MDMTTVLGDTTAAPDRPGTAHRSWTPRLTFSFIAMVLVLEMLSCSYLMVSVALPQISTHFRTNQGVWIITAFLLVGAVASPLIGKLADTYGKRRLLLACVAASAVGALVSALAPTFAVLVVGWSLVGLLSPCLFLVYALIRDVYPPRTVPMAVSISTTGMGLVAVPAPFFTGWIIDNFGFRGVFWFFVIALTALAAIIRVTTEESPFRLRSRIDLIGATLLGIGLGTLLVGISFGPSWGWTATSTLTYLAAGVVFLAAWAVSAMIVRDPIIDLKILAQRPVAMTSLSSGMAWAAVAAFVMLLPMMVMTPSELGLGYGFGADAGRYAWFHVPDGAMTLIGGFLVGALTPRVRPKLSLLVGLTVLGLASLGMALAHTSAPVVVLLGALFGLGGGMAYAATPNLLIEAVPQQLLATAGAIASTAGNILPAILPVLVFAMLNSHIAFAQDGAVVYSDAGLTLGFVMIAGAAVIGLIAALAIPRTIKQAEVPAEV